MPAVPKPNRVRRPTYLRAWREFKGLTQQAVADRIEMSRENYGRIENGLVPYDQYVIEGVAEALGLTLADLLERDPLIEQQVDELRELLTKASPADRKRILRAAKSYIDNNDI